MACTHEGGQIDFSIETKGHEMLPNSDFDDPEKLLDIINNIQIETINAPYSHDYVTWEKPN